MTVTYAHGSAAHTSVTKAGSEQAPQARARAGVFGMLVLLAACSVDDRPLGGNTAGSAGVAGSAGSSGGGAGGSDAGGSANLAGVGGGAAVLGADCSTGAECASQNCADGVCCNTACTEVCAACNIAPNLGTCSAAPSDAACDSIACSAVSTECNPLDESGLAQNCASLGACKSAAECPPQPALAGTPCEQDAGTCDGDGACQVPSKAALGQSCSIDDDCAEGHCVADGAQGALICCDAACDGICEACGSDGRCEATAEDPACDAVPCAALGVGCRTSSDITSNLCRGRGECKDTTDCDFDNLPDGTACSELVSTFRVCQGGDCVDPPVRCGQETCGIDVNNTCCFRGEEVVNAGYSCEVRNDCGNSGLQQPIQFIDCDSPNDCRPGDVCCIDISVGARFANVTCNLPATATSTTRSRSRCVSRSCAAASASWAATRPVPAAGPASRLATTPSRLASPSAGRPSVCLIRGSPQRRRLRTRLRRWRHALRQRQLDLARLHEAREQRRRDEQQRQQVERHRTSDHPRPPPSPPHEPPIHGYCWMQMASLPPGPTPKGQHQTRLGAFVPPRRSGARKLILRPRPPAEHRSHALVLRLMARPCAARPTVPGGPARWGMIRSKRWMMSRAST